MLVSLTVGKVDAGVAVLLTEDKRLIEFPSILLPPSITSGSIVDITVAQNFDAEQKSQAAFESLQSQILNTYGLRAPATPELRLRNATQSTIVLEWDPVQLATTTLRSLALYRNGQKAGNIPRPMDMLSTKISGLQMNTEYSFYMILRTSGGTYTSNTLTVKTHDMSNLTGIRVTPGVLPPQLRESLETAVERIGAKIVDSPRIDTTHFVCTEGRGKDWERANEMNIPVVRPEWIEGCEREGKIIGVRGYYLDANPKHRQIGSNPSLSGPAAMASPASQQAMAASQAELPVRQQQQQQQQPPDPKSPDRESTVSGEPGPEVNEPPSPPPKDEGEGHHSQEPEAGSHDDGDESENEGPEVAPPRVANDARPEATSQEVEESSDEEEPVSTDGARKSRESQEDPRDKGGEMEDVDL
ncbi:Cell fusion protein cfr1 [Cyphellophora attinorum]|uniref:Cell fusion protein cfr1 n=1 Tax=Cyphellophora attinorum TaxID=1664694 RepID=A0A0N1HSN8_9EURO|nr:Cell fusion protein cfr1 [Phialophora attinorum]KPI41685.1 Cell fusion protein cfr1 [Phialophora attinorum]